MYKLTVVIEEESLAPYMVYYGLCLLWIATAVALITVSVRLVNQGAGSYLQCRKCHKWYEECEILCPNCQSKPFPNEMRLLGMRLTLADEATAERHIENEKNNISLISNLMTIRCFIAFSAPLVYNSFLPSYRLTPYSRHDFYLPPLDIITCILFDLTATWCLLGDGARTRQAPSRFSSMATRFRGLPKNSDDTISLLLPAILYATAGAAEVCGFIFPLIHYHYEPLYRGFNPSHMTMTAAIIAAIAYGANIILYAIAVHLSPSHPICNQAARELPRGGSAAVDRILDEQLFNRQWQEREWSASQESETPWDSSQTWVPDNAPTNTASGAAGGAQWDGNAPSATNDGPTVGDDWLF